MKATKTLLLAILLTTVALSAGARDYHFWDANELLQRCQGFERAERGERARNPNEVAAGSLEYGTCVGYIVGTVDTMSALGALWEITGTPLPLMCVPNITPNQAVALVRRYFEAHPQNLNVPAANIVAAALIDAYPCAKTPSR